MKLIVEKGAAAGREHAIGGDVVIGRLPSCTIALSDTKASREHARLYVESGAAYVADLGSSNGTFVNGHRITAPARLSAGDRIMIGETTFRFHEEPRPKAEAATAFTERPKPAARSGHAAAKSGAPGPGDIQLRRRILQYSVEKNRPRDGVLIQDLGQRSFAFRLALGILGIALVAALTYGIAYLVSHAGGRPSVAPKNDVEEPAPAERNTPR